MDFWQAIATGNTRTWLLLVFFATFVGILIYVFGGKKRSARLESYKHIPFQDDPSADDDRDQPDADRRNDD